MRLTGEKRRLGRSSDGSKGATRKKTRFMKWVDDELEADPRLARAVEDLVVEMKLEQQIVALREKRGLTQRQLARLLGTSQPYVAKLESGRVKNLGVRTLVKCARALGASVSIRMDPLRRSAPTARSRLRKAG
jgi:predicted XRE-type DNA-binding protein